MKKKLRLVAETTRGTGKWQYSHIVAPDINLAEYDVTKIIVDADNKSYKNYLSVNTEIAPGKSGRIGKETLVLVATEQLSPEQREQAMPLLKQKLTALEQLVAHKIDWETEGKQSIVKRSELGKWEQDFRDLPSFLETQTQKSTLKKWSIPVMSFAVIALIGVLISSFYSCTGNKVSTINYYEKFLTELETRAWKMPQKKEVCSDEQISADEQILVAECELRKKISKYEIEQELNKLLNKKDNFKVSIMMLPRNPRHQRIYLDEFTEFEGLNLNQIVEKRDILRTIFTDFQSIAENLSPSLFDKCRIDSDEYPYLAFACRISEFALEAKDVVNKESNLPFFSESDVLRAKFLKKMTGKAQETKLIQKDEHTLTSLCWLGKSHEMWKSRFLDDIETLKNDDKDKDDNRDIVSMNKAVMKFFNKLSNAGLECN